MTHNTSGDAGGAAGAGISEVAELLDYYQARVALMSYITPMDDKARITLVARIGELDLMKPYVDRLRAALREAPAPQCHGPMRLIYAQHRCETCGSVDELAPVSALRAPQEGPDPLQGLRDAKYLNPVCAEDGCQWLRATADGGSVPTANATHEKLELHRCKVCGTRWLLWPATMSGGGWNLLDKHQRPGACCDNAAMGEQIEHLRDIPLAASASALSPEPQP